MARSDLPIRINRDAPPPALVPFTDHFRGFERVGAVRDVFGEKTDEVLGRLRVLMIPNRYMYMGVRDQDGNLAVGTYHLEHSDLRTLYLDIVHELFHVRQFMEDRVSFRREHLKYLKHGFDTSLYYRSPIEVPAYRHAVDEALRIGVPRDEIVEYLRIGPVDPKVFARFLKRMGLERGGAAARGGAAGRIPVRIERRVSVKTYHFTEYFEGFEAVDAVRRLFGGGTEEVLGGLRVAFSPSPIGFVSLDDGRLLVNSSYLKEGDPRLIYTDVLVCLNLLKRTALDGRPMFDSGGRGGGPTPVVLESYASAIDEARRIGVSDVEVRGHLIPMRFMMTPEGFRELVERLGLGAPGGRPGARLRAGTPAAGTTGSGGRRARTRRRSSL